MITFLLLKTSTSCCTTKGGRIPQKYRTCFKKTRIWRWNLKMNVSALKRLKRQFTLICDAR